MTTQTPVPGLGGGTPMKHPPFHGGDHTSANYALNYVKQEIPGISAHDLVQLVASVGSETHGDYTFQSLKNATDDYKANGSFPGTTQHGGTPDWKAYVGKVITAARNHGHTSWVKGFSYTATDVPGSGGKTPVEKIADSGPATTVVNIGKGIGDVAGGLGSLLSSPLTILLVVAIVIILVAKK